MPARGRKWAWLGEGRRKRKKERIGISSDAKVWKNQIIFNRSYLQPFSTFLRLTSLTLLMLPRFFLSCLGPTFLLNRRFNLFCTEIKNGSDRRRRRFTLVKIISHSIILWVTWLNALVCVIPHAGRNENDEETRPGLQSSDLFFSPKEDAFGKKKKKKRFATEMGARSNVRGRAVGFCKPAN